MKGFWGAIAIVVLLLFVFVAPVAAVDDVPQVEMSGTAVSAVVAVLTSILLAYVPGMNAWWKAFAHKREMLAGVGLVVTWGMVGLHYAGAINLGIGVFGWPVVWRTVEAWLAFSGAGQMAYTVEQRWRDVLRAR